MKVSPPQCFLCHHHLHIMLRHMLRNFNASHPEFQFLGLPSVTPPPLEDVLACPEHFVSIFVADHRDHVKDAIFNDALSNKSPGLKADKIAKAVKDVIEGSSEVKSKVKAMSEIERKALLEGESSFVAFETLVSVLSANKA
uniref:Uncharacterized protein n=1 Tax=Populus alba TaxID=43335 RepID=A0A4U5QA54_POPAL|nr:hypothetical protein D5086_0000130680 [Populus alba]